MRLKYCPFCGSSEVKAYYTGVGYTIACSDCSAKVRFTRVERDYNRGRFTMTAEAAERETIRRWNGRVIHIHTERGKK